MLKNIVRPGVKNETEKRESFFSVSDLSTMTSLASLISDSHISLFGGYKLPIECIETLFLDLQFLLRCRMTTRKIDIEEAVINSVLHIYFSESLFISKVRWRLSIPFFYGII